MYTLKDLEYSISIYTDVIRKGLGSKFIKSVWDCLSVLEHFEEYEKCKDLYAIIGVIKNKVEPNKNTK